METRIIKHGSQEYEQMVALRFDVLRKPLGLTFTEEQLLKEKDYLLLGLFDGNEIVGCCVLRKESSEEVQLHQMAVHTSIQSSGLGKQTLLFAEQVARQHAFKKLFMHARRYAEGFYANQGYTIEGDEFEEVGIPHIRMVKALD